MRPVGIHSDDQPAYQDLPALLQPIWARGSEDLEPILIFLRLCAIRRMAQARRSFSLNILMNSYLRARKDGESHRELVRSLDTT